MKRNLIAVLFLVAVFVCSGCGGGGGKTHPNWSVPQPQRTGVAPSIGGYNFVMKNTVDPLIVVTLDVVEKGGKKFIELYHYKGTNDTHNPYFIHTIPVENDGVLYYFGDIAPGLGSYPYEGFAISGNVTSPTRMEGEIEFATYGYIIGKTSFVATLK